MESIYSRKTLFTDLYNSDEYIKVLNIPNKIRDEIFDKLYYNFSILYPKKSFLPYHYIFFDILNDFGYNYPILVKNENKLKAF